MRIGIVAGESSGDLLGAGLISAIKEKHPDAIIEGIAGPEMIKQGCKALYPSDKLALLGIVEVLAHYRELRGVRNDIYQHFLSMKPDVFVGIDAPEFNLGLHQRLHDAGISTVQYVSPQIWAWRQGRVRKISKYVDLVMSLFPFEADFYKDHSVPVEFVGHPLADMIPMQPDVSLAREQLELPPGKRCVALLPGSRVSEVKRLLDPFIDAARLCLDKKPDLFFVLPIANNAVSSLVVEKLSDSGLPIKVVHGHSRDVMAAADVILMASGTAALEGLLLKKPMVIAYRVAWLSAIFLRRLVKLPYYSLPNLLAGRQVIPEVIQERLTPGNLASEVLDFLDHPEKVSQLVETFESIHSVLQQGTNRRAADAVLRLAEDAGHQNS